jgi:hypothetical protein
MRDAKWRHWQGHRAPLSDFLASRGTCAGVSALVASKRSEDGFCFSGLLPYSIFYLPSSVFSAFGTPHSALRNSLVASALAKWLLKILKLRNKPILFAAEYLMQHIMNQSVISKYEQDFRGQFRKNKPI